MAKGVFFGGLIHQGMVMTIIKVLELYALNDLSSRPVWATDEVPGHPRLIQEDFILPLSNIPERDSERGETKQS